MPLPECYANRFEGTKVAGDDEIDPFRVRRIRRLWRRRLWECCMVIKVDEKGNQNYLDIQLWATYPLPCVGEVQVSHVSYFKSTF